MKIMLITAKNIGLTKLSLTDNSHLLCGKVNLSLIYLRTMEKGRPFYAKYKFVPKYKEDKYVFYNNNEIYNTNPTISKTRLLKFINKINLDEVFASKNIGTYIKTQLEILPDKIIIKDLITKLILDSKNIKDVCILLGKIYMGIYSYANYGIYINKTFELILDNLSINQ